MADPYTLKHVDDFEVMEGSGDSTWRLARKSLGTDSLGFNVVDIGPGGKIPAHDEGESGQVEVFVILDGDATMIAGDDEHAAPAGTFCVYEPETHRGIENRSDSGVRALLIGVPKDSGYEVGGWA
jgi:quercetin dioxygenase-like cupin family protein